jgi:hypothetical protein
MPVVITLLYDQISEKYTTWILFLGCGYGIMKKRQSQSSQRWEENTERIMRKKYEAKPFFSPQRIIFLPLWPL